MMRSRMLRIKNASTSLSFRYRSMTRRPLLPSKLAEEAERMASLSLAKSSGWSGCRLNAYTADSVHGTDAKAP